MDESSAQRRFTQIVDISAADTDRGLVELERFLGELGPAFQFGRAGTELRAHGHHLWASLLGVKTNFDGADTHLQLAEQLYSELGDRDGIETCRELHAELLAVARHKAMRLMEVAQRNAALNMHSPALDDVGEAAALFLRIGDSLGYAAALGTAIPLAFAVGSELDGVAMARDVFAISERLAEQARSAIVGSIVEFLEGSARRLALSESRPALGAEVFRCAAEGYRLLGQPARETSCQLQAEALQQRRR